MVKYFSKKNCIIIGHFLFPFLNTTIHLTTLLMCWDVGKKFLISHNTTDYIYRATNVDFFRVLKQKASFKAEIKKMKFSSLAYRQFVPWDYRRKISNACFTAFVSERLLLLRISIFNLFPDNIYFSCSQIFINNS